MAVVEVVSGPAVTWEEGVGAISMTFKLTDGEVRRVKLVWSSDDPDLSGAGAILPVPPEGLVQAEARVPVRELRLYMALNDVDRPIEGPIWGAQWRIKLEDDGKPVLRLS